MLIATAESSRRCRIVTMDVCAVPPLLVAGDAQGNVFAFAIPTDLPLKGAHSDGGKEPRVLWQIREGRSGSYLEMRRSVLKRTRMDVVRLRISIIRR